MQEMTATDPVAKDADETPAAASEATADAAPATDAKPEKAKKAQKEPKEPKAKKEPKADDVAPAPHSKRHYAKSRFIYGRGEVAHVFDQGVEVTGLSHAELVPLREQGLIEDL